MARARNIKPAFFLNEDLVEMPFEVRLLFIGLWTVADREGRLADRPKHIKMAVFPADEGDVDKGLQMLADAKLINRYVVKNERFIEIPNFLKHQTPHYKEKASLIPASGKTKASPRQTQDKPPLNPDIRNDDSLNPDIRIPDTHDPVLEVFENWRTVLNHPKSELDKKRKDRIKARFADGFTLDELMLVPHGVLKSPYHLGGNPEGTVYTGISTISRDR